jgi:hypothetical protein
MSNFWFGMLCLAPAVFVAVLTIALQARNG